MLQSTADDFAKPLLRPVLTCVNDPNIVMRKAALDALFNVLKCLQLGIRDNFTDIFTVLSNSSMDLDQEVKLAVEMCDRALKDVVSMDWTFDTDKFVVVARERLIPDDPFARMFHLGWISFLEDFKNFSLVRYLPDLLDGVLVCLGDSNRDIQTA